MPRLVAPALTALALALALPAIAAGATSPVTAFAASLTASGERPAPKGVPAGAGGSFSAVVTTSGGKTTLAWRLAFTHLSGAALAAHVHTGQPGREGPVSIPLCGPCSSGAHGIVTVDAKVAAAIESGGTYVNVHTKANPAGEIRGQLGRSDTVAAGLVGSGETPAAQSVPAGAKGSFTATIIQTAKRPILVWSLSFEGLSGPAVGAHIHLGKPGAAGPIALPLCGPCTLPLTGRKAIDANLAAAIETGGTYVNVHTQANPAGEIRGQVMRATQGVAALSTGLGTILVDDRGMTLYMWTKDEGETSACYERCAGFWPPALVVAAPVAASGAVGALLGTTARSDGTTELTYGGHPLYGFLADQQPGDTKGQGSNGFGAPWWVVTPATGKPSEAKSAG